MYLLYCVKCWIVRRRVNGVYSLLNNIDVLHKPFVSSGCGHLAMDNSQ